MLKAENEFLTVPEVAELLRVPRTRAYMLIAEGSLPAIKIGERSIRVHRGQLEEFLLSERRTGPQSETDGEEASLT